MGLYLISKKWLLATLYFIKMFVETKRSEQAFYCTFFLLKSYTQLNFLVEKKQDTKSNDWYHSLSMIPII